MLVEHDTTRWLLLLLLLLLLHWAAMTLNKVICWWSHLRILFVWHPIVMGNINCIDIMSHTMFYHIFPNFLMRLPLWHHSNPMTSKKGLKPWSSFFFVSFLFINTINTILLRTNTRPPCHKHDQKKRKENCPRDVDIDKGAPELESRTGGWLVSPAIGCKKKKMEPPIFWAQNIHFIRKKIHS